MGILLTFMGYDQRNKKIGVCGPDNRFASWFSKDGAIPCTAQILKILNFSGGTGILFKTKPLNRLTGQVIGGWLSLSYEGWTQEHVQQHHPYLNRSV